MLLGGDQFLLSQWQTIKERLHGRLTEAPAALMRSLLMVTLDPCIQVSLQLVNATIELVAERDSVALVQHGLVEALDNNHWCAGSWS